MTTVGFKPLRGIVALPQWLAAWLVFLPIALTATAAPDVAAPDVDPKITWARTADPDIELGPIRVQLPPGIEGLWLKALRHPGSDLRREAADSLTRAHRLAGGTEQLSPADLKQLSEALIDVLETPDEHAVALTAAARALVEIDARGAAGLLIEHARRGPIELSLSVEPALARWDFQPARALWLQRLNDPTTPATLLHLSIACLGDVAESRAIPELSRLVTAPTVSASTRLAAAKALAKLPADDLVELSRQLAAGSSHRPRLTQLIGVHLLAHQSSDAARELLDEYAVAEDPTVAAQAMQRLLEVDPRPLTKRAASTIQHPDARIRSLTVQALATEPSETSIGILVPFLDDRVPRIREEVRRTLLSMSSRDELRPVVIEQTTQTLRGDQWRGLEQAILILTELDQEQVGQRFLELLRHPRPEVYVSAAWGLKTLAAPELSEAIFEEAQRISVESLNEEAAIEVSTALSHLLEALGPLNHQPADSFLRTFIPKTVPYYTEVRAAAIWSLGHLAAESPDPELVRQLQERLLDHNPIMPEELEIRALSAVSLGRMNSAPSLPALRQEYAIEGPNTYLGRCCGWAIEQLTGESMPDAEPSIRVIENWPIRPIQD